MALQKVSSRKKAPHHSPPLPWKLSPCPSPLPWKSTKNPSGGKTPWIKRGIFSIWRLGRAPSYQICPGSRVVSAARGAACSAFPMSLSSALAISTLLHITRRIEPEVIRADVSQVTGSFRAGEASDLAVLRLPLASCRIRDGECRTAELARRHGCRRVLREIRRLTPPARDPVKPVLQGKGWPESGQPRGVLQQICQGSWRGATPLSWRWLSSTPCP